MLGRRLVTAALLALAGAPPAGGAEPGPEVVATGIPRPLQLAIDGRTLVVLSPGVRGDAAGELYRIALDAGRPVDLARQPRVRIPFADDRLAALGSLAIDPASGQLFLGEENGRRIYRLGADGRLGLYAAGLHRLPGGGTLAFDTAGRLVVLDYVDPAVGGPDERPPPEQEPFRDEDYRGPLVFRLALEPDLPLPRRLDRLSPLFPRGWGGRQGGGLLPRLISVAPLPAAGLAFLSSGGEVLRLGSDGRLVGVARLPPGHGQYNRTSMVAAPDGTLFVSGGFHVARVFRVGLNGAVATVAANLADPEGIVLDDRVLYVAESALHRIVRIPVPRP